MTWRTNAMPSPSPVVVDSTVFRSLGVLGLGSALLEHWECVTLDVIFDPPDGGELRRITSTIRGEVERLQHGSSASSLWSEALYGLDNLIVELTRRTVLRPTDQEMDLAGRLASKNDAALAWRHEHGIGVRRIDSGEAVCLAVAMMRTFGFATDDRPAAAAFDSLTGRSARSSFDALDHLHAQGLVNDVEGAEQRLVRLRGPLRSERPE